MENESIENLIERYESTIEDLEDKVDNLETKLEKAENWAKAKAFYAPISVKDDGKAPVPRLQISLTKHSDSHWEWLYCLVYRHTVGHLEGIPIGSTTSRGGHQYDTFDTQDNVHRSLPFRDGVHIRRDSWQLSLPAFALVDGVYYDLEPISD